MRMMEKLYRLPGAITGKKQSIDKESIVAFGSNLCVSNAKAVNELGYQTMPLEESLLRTVDWYKQKYGKAGK